MCVAVYSFISNSLFLSLAKTNEKVNESLKINKGIMLMIFIILKVHKTVTLELVALHFSFEILISLEQISQPGPQLSHQVPAIIQDLMSTVLDIKIKRILCSTTLNDYQINFKYQSLDTKITRSQLRRNHINTRGSNCYGSRAHTEGKYKNRCLFEQQSKAKRSRTSE